MNYKKLNEIKAGKAVYRHDGTLEQLHEVEVYCEGTDSHRMKGVASYYHMGVEAVIVHAERSLPIISKSKKRRR